MLTIAQAIEKTIAKLNEAGPTVRIATDDDVARVIVEIGEKGYRPSVGIVEPIRSYLSGYGVLLTGRAGVGKTYLMQCLGVRLYTAEEIMSYGFHAIHTFWEWTDGHEICIDDVGVERVATEYGAKDDLLKSVIAHRAERQKGRTHVTTNLTADEIAARYGDRTLSRLLGMCRPFTMDGRNRREARQHTAQTGMTPPASTVRHVEAISATGAA